MLEFSRTEQRKARKDHKCDVCGKPILKGREYVFVSQKYDGEINTFHQHIHCDALLEAYLASDWYDGDEYSLDEVWEWLSDLCNDLYHEGKCSEEDYEENCDKERCFECPLIFEKVLKPEIRRAAEQDVRDNTRREN